MAEEAEKKSRLCVAVTLVSEARDDIEVSLNGDALSIGQSDEYVYIDCQDIDLFLEAVAKVRAEVGAS